MKPVPAGRASTEGLPNPPFPCLAARFSGSRRERARRHRARGGLERALGERASRQTWSKKRPGARSRRMLARSHTGMQQRQQQQQHAMTFSNARRPRNAHAAVGPRAAPRFHSEYICKSWKSAMCLRCVAHVLGVFSTAASAAGSHGRRMSFWGVVLIGWGLFPGIRPRSFCRDFGTTADGTTNKGELTQHASWLKHEHIGAGSRLRSAHPRRLRRRRAAAEPRCALTSKGVSHRR